MWTAKIRLIHKDCITSQLTKKYHMTNLVYGLGYYSDKKYTYYNILHIPFGKENKKKAFIEEVKKDKRIIKFEQCGNMFFTLVKEKKIKDYLKELYNPKLFFLKPDLNTPTGHEIYEIASWDKKEIEKFIYVAKKYMKGELLKIKEEKSLTVFFPHVMAGLTNKQHRALSLAHSNGYYNYPRRANQDDLARIMGVSKSTYQSHLRAAERKLMPFMIGQAEMMHGE